MKVFLRILMFLVVLVLLAGLAAVLSVFVAVPWLSAFVAQLQTAYSWLSLAFAVVLLVLGAACVLALVLLISVPIQQPVYVVPRNMGNIEITRQSIESAAGHALTDVEDIKQYTVQLKGNPLPEKIRLAVHVEPRTAAVDMVQLGDQVQAAVRENLKKYLEVDPTFVNVKIQLYSRGEVESHAKAGRVV